MSSSSWRRAALHNAFLRSTIERQSTPTTPQTTEPDPVLFPAAPLSPSARSPTASEAASHDDTIEPSALSPLAGVLQTALKNPKEDIPPEEVSIFGTPPQPMRFRRGSDAFENLNQEVQGSLHPREERGIDSDSDDEYETSTFFRGRSNYQEQYLQRERAKILGNRRKVSKQREDDIKQTEDSMEEVEAFFGGGEDSEAMWRLSPDQAEEVGHVDTELADLKMTQALSPMGQIEGLAVDEQEILMQYLTSGGIVPDKPTKNEPERMEGVEVSSRVTSGPPSGWPALPRVASVDAESRTDEVPETRRRFSDDPSASRMAVLRIIGLPEDELEQDTLTPVEYARQLLGLDLSSDEEEETPRQRQDDEESTRMATPPWRIPSLAEYQASMTGNDDSSDPGTIEALRKDSGAESRKQSDTVIESTETSSPGHTIPFTRWQRDSLRGRRNSSPSFRSSPSPDFPHGYTTADEATILPLFTRSNYAIDTADDDEDESAGQVRQPLKNKVRQLTAFG
ncbi:hypothetical protein MBLNU457_4847t2 [Dothideomycetes sp. NU457]